MTDRAEQKAEERRKKRAGFVHIAGWVRVSDAPAIRRKIEAVKDEVERIKEQDQ